jgi:hypothetical protein
VISIKLNLSSIKSYSETYGTVLYLWMELSGDNLRRYTSSRALAIMHQQVSPLPNGSTNKLAVRVFKYTTKFHDIITRQRTNLTVKKVPSCLAGLDEEDF